MTLIFTQGGYVVMRDGLVGLSDPCCCWKYCCHKYEDGVLVGRACSPEPCPEGWEQVSPHGTASDCADECCCPTPKWWRIVDSENRVYAQGPMVNCAPVDYPGPCSFPQYYWPPTNGPQWCMNLRLEVQGCNGGAFDLVTQASYCWETCGGECAQWFPPSPPYPPNTVTGTRWLASPPFFEMYRGMPSGCECESLPGVPAPLTQCGSCDGASFFPISFSGTGTGQAWRSTLFGPAVKFTGAVDGEWTNLNNWQDASGLSPAYSLPTATSDVIIEGNVTSKPATYSAAVRTLTVEGSVGIEITCETLLCRGIIARPASPLCQFTFGKIIYTSSATIAGGPSASSVDGELVQSPGASAALFAGAPYPSNTLAPLGVVTGDAVFEGLSVCYGTITGNATFNDSSVNYFDNLVFPPVPAVIEGNATFNDTSGNYGSVLGDATFNSGAFNGGSVSGDAVFNNSSKNEFNVLGDAVFNDASSNVDGGTVSGAAIFNDSSLNNDGATVLAGTTFNGNAKNDGSVLNAVFNDNSRNTALGSVDQDATFNNSARNLGHVTGTATFNDSSCNSGTAGTFAPNPPPAC